MIKINHVIVIGYVNIERMDHSKCKIHIIHLACYTWIDVIIWMSFWVWMQFRNSMFFKRGKKLKQLVLICQHWLTFWNFNESFLSFIFFSPKKKITKQKYFSKQVSRTRFVLYDNVNKPHGPCISRLLG